MKWGHIRMLLSIDKLFFYRYLRLGWLWSSGVFLPPPVLKALCTLVHVDRHVPKLLMRVNYAQRSILLNHYALRVLVGAAEGSGVRGEGRTCLRARTAGQARGAHVEWGLCEAAGRCRRTAGCPPGDAHALGIQSLVTQES